MLVPFRFLTIAGSDSGGGAGLQADLKTAADLGGHGMSVVTALTAQNTVGVVKDGIFPIPADFVVLQLKAVLTDIGADVIKTGMLHNADIIEALIDPLSSLNYRAPLIVDPVTIAKSGHALLCESAVKALKEILFPVAFMITPNLPEAETLTGLPIKTTADIYKAGEILLKTGAHSVLIKGGHGRDPLYVEDYLFTPDTDKPVIFKNSRIVTERAGHGTGCTLASAIACHIASGLSRTEAVEQGVHYVRGALKNILPFGRGAAILKPV